MRFSTTIVFVTALISVNVTLGSVTAYKTSQTNLPDAYALQRGVVPPGVTILIDKGNTLFNPGNYQQAIQYYDKALAIDAKDEVALDNKGIALYGLGNYTQAIQYFNKAIAIDPNYKDAFNNKQIVLSKVRK